MSQRTNNLCCQNSTRMGVHVEKLIDQRFNFEINDNIKILLTILTKVAN